MTLPTLQQRAEGRAPPLFVLFLALMTSVVALSIDAVLPALDTISADLAFADPNDRQLVVLLLLAGMGLSQLVFGTLSDSIGRKPAALIGWGIFLVGTLVCLTATSQAAMLAGRFLQGLGAGGPRIIATAIVRDLYEGRAMARVLSLVMTIFMLVPMLAPLIGQAVEAAAGWRAIFALYLVTGAVTLAWHIASVPETLPRSHRRPLTLRPVAAAFAEVLGSRTAMAYTASAVCVFGPFITYLATAQQLLEEVYGLGPLFPLAFGALAIAFAAASFVNSRLVMGMGMRRLSLIGLCLLTGTSLLALALTLGLTVDGVPPLWLFMGLMAVIFFCVGILFANFNALALRPLGHVAGTASAVVMSLATLGSAPVAFVIARGFDGSLVPMFAAFLGLGIAGTVFMRLAERGSR